MSSYDEMKERQMHTSLNTNAVKCEGQSEGMSAEGGCKRQTGDEDENLEAVAVWRGGSGEVTITQRSLVGLAALRHK